MTVLAASMRLGLLQSSEHDPRLMTVRMVALGDGQVSAGRPHAEALPSALRLGLEERLRGKDELFVRMLFAPAEGGLQPIDHCPLTIAWP